jgi:hypothetical protein
VIVGTFENDLGHLSAFLPSWTLLVGLMHLGGCARPPHTALPNPPVFL